MKSAELFIYSLMILSFAELLLFYNSFVHFKISPSVMYEFNSSSSSVVSILICISSLLSLLCSFRFLKKFIQCFDVHFIVVFVFV